MVIRYKRFGGSNNPHHVPLVEALRAAMDADDLGEPAMSDIAWKEYDRLNSIVEKRKKSNV